MQQQLKSMLNEKNEHEEKERQAKKKVPTNDDLLKKSMDLLSKANSLHSDPNNHDQQAEKVEKH
jgi:hypothetical protein